MRESKSIRTSFLDPLRSKIFLIGLMVNMTSSIGTQMHHISEKLQMAQLTTSPLLMTLLDSSNYLPIMLLGFSAGAIGDTIDRRRLLMVTQTFMLICAAILASLTFLHFTTPVVLLTAAFFLAVGSALTMPAYQSILPELIENERLIPDGVVLNSASYNLSRTIGPAIGGYVFEKLGAGWAFSINSLSFVGVVIALMAWKRHRHPHDTNRTREPIWHTMKAGFQYVRHSKPFKITVLWTSGYCWFGNAVFALGPPLVVYNLKLSSRETGFLMSCVGIGAIIVTFLLRPLRERFKTNNILLLFGLMTVCAHLVIANTMNPYIIGFCLIIVGMSWLTVMSTLNTVIQISIPTDIKARAFGMYYAIWGAIMALGSPFWGKLAVMLTIPTAISVSAVGMLVSLLILNKFKITAIDKHLAKSKKCYDVTPL